MRCEAGPDTFVRDLDKTRYPGGLYQIAGYNVFMHCNTREQRGGTLIYAKAELQVERHEQLMHIGMNDAIWVRLRIPESRREVTVGAAYRKATRGKKQDDNLAKCFDKVSPMSEVVICGDFNSPKIDWEDGTVRDTPGSATQRFYNKLEDRGLVQLVQRATRQRGDDIPSLLDWVIVSREENVEGLQHLALLGAGDHDVLIFTYRDNIRVPVRTKRKMFDFRRADFGGLRRTARTEKWGGVYESDNVNEQMKYFTKVYKDLTRRIPTKPVRMPEEDQKPPWWNGRTERALKKKQCAWRRYNERGKSRKLYRDYEKARRKADTSVKNAKFEFEERLAESSKRNMKAFYRYASKLKTTVPIMSMETEGSITQDVLFLVSIH